jgi:hypothetical protein
MILVSRQSESTIRSCNHHFDVCGEYTSVGKGGLSALTNYVAVVFQIQNLLLTEVLSFLGEVKFRSLGTTACN